MSSAVLLPESARPHRLAWPRTLPFQGSNTGSNPVGDTTPFSADQIIEKITLSDLLLEIVALLLLPILHRCSSPNCHTWQGILHGSRRSAVGPSSLGPLEELGRPTV